MDARTFIQRLQVDGISLRMEDGMLQYDAPKGKITDALLSELRRNKSSIMAELSREGECVPKVAPQPDIYRCSACNGTNWGQTGTLPDGAERWGCLTCAARPEGTLAPPVPESADAIPPWAIPSPCPECGKPYRLFVPASPHIEGEPDRPVLICGKCGHSEQACPECKRSNVVTDALGAYCVDCRKRPGQPDPTPASRTDPTPLPSRRHRLGEPPPTSDCPECGYHDWREAIYHFACKQCQHMEMKS
jgi:hypothetical protein